MTQGVTQDAHDVVSKPTEIVLLPFAIDNSIIRPVKLRRLPQLLDQALTLDGPHFRRKVSENRDPEADKDVYASA